MLRTALALGALGLIVVGLAPKEAQAAAGINQQINFQGRLLTNTGAVVADGNYNIEFKIYQDGPGNVAGDTGGTLKWTEDYQNNTSSEGVAVKNGYFSVALGTYCPFSGAACSGGQSQSNAGVDFNQDTLWLSMNVGGTTTGAPTYDGEMLPMKRLASAVYALQAANAGTLGGIAASGFIQNSTTQQTNANFNIQSAGASSVGAQIQAAASGTATVLVLKNGSSSSGDLLEAQTSTGGVLDAIDSTGNFVMKNGGGSVLGGISNTGNFYAASSLDVQTATTLNIGNTNATQITIGHNPGVYESLSGSGVVVQTAGSNLDTALQVLNSSSTSLLTVDTSSTPGLTVGNYGNMLLDSEQFNTTPWVISGGIGVPSDNSATAPNGTTTASTITTSTSTQVLRQQVTVSPSTTYTFSWYAKAGTMSPDKYSVVDVTHSADIVAATAYSATGSWQRFSVTFTTPAGCTSINVFPIRDSGGTSTGTVFLWGAQLTQSSSTVPYEPTVGTAAIATDAALTVGGSTLVRPVTDSNSAFEVDTASGGTVLNANTNLNAIGVGTSATAGIKLNVASNTATVIQGNSTGGGNLLKLQVNGADSFTVDPTGSVTSKNSADSTGAFQVQNAAGTSLLTVDTANASVNLNNTTSLISPNLSSGSLQNLLRYSEQFNEDNEASTNIWHAPTNVTVSANSTAAPNGATTADTLVGTGSSNIQQTETSVATTGTYTFSVWLKQLSGAANSGLCIYSTGGTPSSCSATAVTPSSSQWQRFSVTQAITGSPTAITAEILPGNGSTASVYAWGAQLVKDSSPDAYVSTLFNPATQDYGAAAGDFYAGAGRFNGGLRVYTPGNTSAFVVSDPFNNYALQIDTANNFTESDIAKFLQKSNSNNSFVVQNASGSTALNVNTLDKSVTVNADASGATRSTALYVVGNTSDSSGAGLTVAAANGNVNAQILNDGTVNLGGSGTIAQYGLSTPGSNLGSGYYNGSGTPNLLSSQKITATTGGTVASISTYIGSFIQSSPNNKGQMAIYADSSGNPGAYIASTAQTTLTGGAWNTWTFTTPVTLSASTDYWLVYWTNDNANDSANAQTYNTGVSGAHWYQAQGTWNCSSSCTNGMPNTMPAGSRTDNNYQFAIYVTYADSAAALHITGSNGAATFENTSNSTSAFQVQNALGVSALSVDTTNMAVTTNVGPLTVNGLANTAAPTLTSSGTGGTLAAGSYYYELSAYDVNFNRTVGMASSPDHVTTSGSTSKNTLSWSAVANASGYTVYRSTDGGTTWYYNNVSAGTTSIVDDGSAYSWTSAGGPDNNFNGTGGIHYQSGTSLCADASTCDAQLTYIPNYNYLALSNFASGGGVTLQGDYFNFRDTTGYNNDLLINNSGQATFKNRTDSSTAFQVQKAGGSAAVFTVDTADGNGIVSIGQGAAGTSTPAWLYLNDIANNTGGQALVVGQWTSNDNWGIGPGSNGLNTDDTLRIGVTSANGANTWNNTHNLNLVVTGSEKVATTTGNDTNTTLQVQNQYGSNVLNVDTASGQATVGNTPGSVQEWDAHGTNQTTVGDSPHVVGDLVMLGVLINGTSGATVSSVSGGGVTTWTKATAFTDSTNNLRTEIWEGSATSTGSSTITATYSATPGAVTELAAQEFAAGSGASWSVGTAGNALNGSSTTVTFPTLSTSTTAQLYWGFMGVQNTGGSGSTPGFSYLDTGYNNIIGYGTDLAPGPYTPTASQNTAGWSSGAAVIMSVTNTNNAFTVNGSQTVTGTNSNNAFQVQNSNGSAALAVDTANSAVNAIGKSAVPTHVNTWQAHATNQTTVSVSPATTGNLIALAIEYATTGISVTSVSGGGVTNWHRVKVNDVSSHQEIWEGTVTSTGASTITAAYSGTPGVNTELYADEFTAGLGAGTNWYVTATGSINNSSSGTITLPTLTATQTNGLYWSYARTGSSAATNSGGGFTDTATGSSNLATYNLSMTAGTSYSHTATTSPNAASDAVAMIIAPTVGGLNVDNALQVGGNSTFLNGVSVQAGTNAAAFQVQNATGNADLTVDTSGDQVVLGKASSLSGKLVVDNSSNSNTVTIQPGTISASYTLVLPNLTGGSYNICTDSGNCNGAGGTLQTSYNNSIGSTTPEIKLDATRGGVDIQDADTTINGSLFTVRGSNGSGLGTAILDIKSTGQVYVQSAVDTETNTGLAIGNANATGVSIGNSGANNLTTIYGAGLVQSSSAGNSTTAFQVKANSTNYSTPLLNTDTTNLGFSAGTQSSKLGYTSVGASANGGVAGWMEAEKISTTSAGTMSSISVYLGAIDATNPQYQVALYDDKTSGCNLSLTHCPGNRLAFTGDNTPLGYRWNTASISHTLSASTTYWLVLSVKGTGDTPFYDSGAPAGTYVAQNNTDGAVYNTWPSSFGTDSFTNSVALSMFANVNTGSDGYAISTDSNGHVGIGTSTPSSVAALYVNGLTGGGIGQGINVQGSGLVQSSSFNAFDVIDASGTVQLLQVDAGDKATYINTSSGGSGTTATLNLGLNGSNDALVVDGPVSYLYKLTNSGDVNFGNSVNHSITMAQAGSGAGKNLTVAAGQGASGSTGGNLLLQAGANGTANGVPGSVIVQANGGDSTSAFQVQNAGSTPLLTADTTNMQVTALNTNVGSLSNVGGTSGRQFSDGFETGNTGLWSGIGGTGTLSMQTATVRNGKYAESLATTNTHGAYVQYSTSSNSLLYGRMYFNVATLGNLTPLMDFGTAAMGSGNHLYIDLEASGNICYHQTLGAATATACSATAPSIGAWHKLEVKVQTLNTSSGILQVWLDGTLVSSNSNAINLSGVNFGSTNLRNFAIGNTDTVANATSTTYFDDVVVDTGATGDASSLNVADSLHVAGTSTFGDNLLAVNSAGTQILNVDAVNNRVTIGSGSSSAKLYVASTGSTASPQAAARFGSSAVGNILELAGNSQTLGQVTLDGSLQMGMQSGFTGSGTVSSSGSTTLTGTSTNFLSATKAGDVIAYSTNSCTVSVVTDDTHLTCTASQAATSGTYTVTASGNTDKIQIDANGQVGIGTSAAVALTNALTVGGTALFQTPTNTATAFQIQNSSNASLFTADTSASQVLVASSATTGNGMGVTANSLTTGNGLSVSTTSASQTAGYVLNVSSSTTLTGNGGSYSGQLVNVNRALTANVGTVGATITHSSNASFPKGSHNGTGATTLTSMQAQASGDIIFATVLINNTACTVSGFTYASAGTWTRISSATDSTNNNKLEIWYAVASSTTANTISYSTTGCTNNVWNEMTADSYHASSTPTWNIVTSSQRYYAGNASGDILYPSLTASAANQAYFGQTDPQGTFTTSNCSTGFTCTSLDTGSEGVTRNVSLTNGTSYSPTGNQTANDYANAWGVIFEADISGSGAANVNNPVANFSSNCTNSTGTCYDASNVLQVQQQYSTATGAALFVKNAGTGYGLQVQKNGSGTFNPVVNLQQAGSGDATMELQNASDSFYVGVRGTGNSFNISSKDAATASGVVGDDYSSATPNSADANGNEVQGSRFVASASGTISSISVSFDASAAGAAYSVAIYKDDGSGCGSGSGFCPGTLLGKHTGSTTITAPGGYNFNTLALDASVSITSGTAYWLVVATDSSAPTFNIIRPSATNSCYAGGNAFNPTSSTWANWGSGALATLDGCGTDEIGLYASITTGTTDTFSNSLFSMGTTGAATYRNSSNSVSAFVIQDASSQTMMQVDTTNKLVYVGSSNNDTLGVQLVMHNYNSGTDPTGVTNGAIYYNTGGVGGANSANVTHNGAFRCYQAQVWQNCLGMRDIKERRWGYAAAALNSGQLTASGLLGALTQNGGTTDTGQAESMYVSYTTGTTNGNTAGVTSAGVTTEGQWEPKLVARVRTGTSGQGGVANQRDWVALASASATANDGTGSIVGLRYSTSASDTDWQCVSNNGGTAVVQDTGVAVSANTYYDVIVDNSISGVVICSVSVAGGAYTTVHNTSGTPSASTTLFPETSITTLTGAARTMEVEYFFVEQN